MAPKPELLNEMEALLGDDQQYVLLLIDTDGSVHMIAGGETETLKDALDIAPGLKDRLDDVPVPPRAAA